MNITGRLTRDAEVNTTKGGKEVVNFSVAVNESYKNKQGERVNNTAYFNCSFWKSTKVMKFLTKGVLVELTGHPSARAWLTTDGQPKAELNFHTSNIKALAGVKKADPVQNTADQPMDTEKEDLPF
ncbi:hypothetical protein SF1_18380 [Sphingobacterium faecium NBRC 15299]|uniref:single-stranded DNA-binding protein n=1 Tax=Sphingobacterium faecium TaxID=34087 RepID=UPI000D3DBC83|nr:single-stranded DNA-binding protein [Sphingobacterium faecium]PTX09523.1 single-strand DNA-binding protein [Sphingobacterium faecium]GEM63856.1 hypothetical protein SF1_18380 [Sphingobacterium faecium NBRC 15299]